MDVEMLTLKKKELADMDLLPGSNTFNQYIPTLKGQLSSLKTKGFMRSYASYTPPSNLEEIFLEAASSVLGRQLDVNTLDQEVLDNLDVKFKVLSALSQALSHSVYNSRLSDMKTLADAYTFYQVNITILITSVVCPNFDNPPSLP